MKFPSWFSVVVTASLCVIAGGCSQAQSSASPVDDTIGILQCDQYLTKVRACIDQHVPASRRAALANETRQLFATWREAANDPQQRSTLPQACAVNLDVATEQMAEFGCSF